MFIQFSENSEVEETFKLPLSIFLLYSHKQFLSLFSIMGDFYLKLQCLIYIFAR